MELLGDGAKLVALRMNGKTLRKGAPDKNNPSKTNKIGYSIADRKLRIANAPDEITLEIETLVEPEKNTSMMGLYISNGTALPNARPKVPARSPGSPIART